MMSRMAGQSGPTRDGHPSPFRTDLAKFEAILLGQNASKGQRARFWLRSSELHCVASLRLAQELDRNREAHPIATRLARIPVGYWHHRHGITHHFHISRQASIGPGFLVMHRTGIWVGGDVRIGSNCVIHHNVTIGQRVARGDHRVPRIGSNVWIGPGAILTGDISVGDGVTISAGSVLSRSVPDGCLVAGNPARVIQTDYDNSGLINFDLPGAQGAGLPSSGRQVTQERSSLADNSA